MGEMPDFRMERKLEGLIAGIDEAGRGPLAGPVVAAAVILARKLPRKVRSELDDSKKVAKPMREYLFAALQDCARIGVGIAHVEEIDRINILQASLLAMVRATEALGVLPDTALVDGNQPPKLACAVQCVVGGDGRSLSVAAASIIAKVTRDRIMVDLHGLFPVYGWETNAGYGTPEHQAAMDSHGVTPHHRRSFAPVFKILNRQSVLLPDVVSADSA